MSSRGSIVMGNPLDSGLLGEHFNIKAESLSDAKPISNDQLSTILTKLNSTEENSIKLDILDTEKQPYIFCSEDLAKLVEVTPSIKTKIQIISMIGPRLTDPRAKMEYFISMFRFSEEKSAVEEILKARTVTMNSAMFTKVNTVTNGTTGRGGGRSGGRLGNSAGRGPSHNRGGSDVIKLDTIDNEVSGESTISATDRRSSIRNSISKSHSDLSNLAGVEVSTHSVKSLGDLSSESPNSVADANPPIAIAARAPVARNSVTSSNLRKNSESKLLDPSRPKSIVRESSVPVVDAAQAPDAATIAKLNRKTTGVSLAELLEQDVKQAADSGKETDTNASMKVRKDSWIKKEESASICASATSSPEVRISSDVQKLRASFSSVSTVKPPLSKHHSMGYKTIASPGSDDSTGSNSSKYNRRNSEISMLSRNIYNVTSPSTVAAIASTVSNDVANKCAAVLKIDKTTFLSLQPEDAMYVDGDNQFFSFKELVRRNYTKEYLGLVQSDLEKYLIDEEFFTVFEKEKEQFSKQPRWKQMEQKKKAMLF